MNPMIRQYAFPAFLLLLAGGILGSQLEWGILDRDTTQQLRKLEEAFLIINKRYVEQVDPRSLADQAIEAMLGGLDPHSSYIDAESFKEVNEGYQGEFGGIGIWFEISPHDTTLVVSVIAGGPSEKAGLLAGDRIILVDGEPLVGATQDEVSGRLKGPVGTQVEVTLLRLGVQDPLTVTITRDLIPLYSIAAAYMLDESTAYMRIGRFARTTHAEFQRHLARLKDRGMTRLMLDLRDNPGGIMDAAVDIVDEVLKDGKMIVYTHGRAVPDQEYHSSRKGLMESQPIIVLVNGNSVSASEIVAGALQDHDRALIVGQRTYGKGLVQNQFALPDDSRLQMTTSRYYTPSGRLIQQPYLKGDRSGYIEDKVALMQQAAADPEAYNESLPDSLKYRTAHGRTVYGGGGIFPDVLFRRDSLLSPVEQVMAQGILLNPLRTWFNLHERKLRSDWDGRLEEFTNSFVFDQASIDEILQLSTSEDSVDVTALNEEQDKLQLYLKSLLTRQLFGSEAAYPLYNRLDPVIAEAQTMWGRAAALPFSEDR